MDPTEAKTLVDPKTPATMPAQHRGYASTILGETGAAVAETEADLPGDEGFMTRYELRASLGEGGMGEVHLCKDRRIGREVALKVIRKGVGSRTDVHKRFLREARVQGQLEHPAIVPVYDLGRDPNGIAFFTMKRVRGQTLEAILQKLCAGDEETAREYTVRKLLTAFVSVCQAVHFAHTRGVLHRDLKPANVMLGDFGEVYVLDWGLARLYSSAEDPSVAHVEVEGDAPGKTAHGAVMGTPGYMSPEQIRGAMSELDERSDVYALGTMLFELLTLEPLHEGDTAERILVETLKGVDARPSARVRGRDVAPELEGICVRATALAARDRYPTARALSDAVEDYLDGDRDLARRREVAAAHARTALTEAEKALAHSDGESRARALQEVGRALALDPSNADAARTLLRLLTEPPRELPPDARAEAKASDDRAFRSAMRTARYVYLSWILYVPFEYLMRAHHNLVGVLSEVMWMLAAGLCFWAYRQPRVDTRTMPTFYVVSALAVAGSSVIMGSLFLVPVIAVANTVGITLVCPPRHRKWVIAAGVLSILVPFALEQTGIVPARYAFEHGTMQILPLAINFPPQMTLLFLVFANLVLIITPCLFVARFRDALHAAEERMILHSWQLRQLVPAGAHSAVPTPPPEDHACMIRPGR